MLMRTCYLICSARSRWLRRCAAIDCNIAAARAVDQEFNYNVGSNLGLFGSGRGSNGRGAPVGFIWAEFQLERSHDDLLRDQNHDFVRPVFLRNDQLAITWY